MIILDQFGTIKNLQRALIPQTSYWSGTIFCRFLQQTGSSTTPYFGLVLIYFPTFIGMQGYNGSPPCGFNTYAPEGEASSDIVTLFAQDHDAWQEAFFNAWEKMGMNGYDKEILTEGPAIGHLMAPSMS